MFSKYLQNSESVKVKILPSGPLQTNVRFKNIKIFDITASNFKVNIRNNKHCAAVVMNHFHVTATPTV